MIKTLCCLFAVFFSKAFLFSACSQSCQGWLYLPGNAWAESSEIDVPGEKMTGAKSKKGLVTLVR